ncbi:MAG: VOC family protein [Phycisphaerales bacterium]
MQLQPYLFFEGRCDEAIEFYRKTVGAEVTMLMRYKDNPEKPDPSKCPGPMPDPEKVMHANLRIGESTLLVSDGHGRGSPRFQGFFLSLTVPDDAAAGRTFNALSAGGKTLMPLGKTFFASSFAMLTDRFGVSWMIYVAS